MPSGRFYILDKGTPNVRGEGDFEFVQHIARFAPLPDPQNPKRRIDESWLVTYTGNVPIFLTSPNGDHRWEGELFLYLWQSLLYDSERGTSRPSARPIRYSLEHGAQAPDPSKPSIERWSDLSLPFEGLPFVIAISGTNLSDGGTFGVGPELGRIEPFPNKQQWVHPPVKPSVPSRPSMRAGLAVWGDGATLSSVAFQLTVTAEFLH